MKCPKCKRLIADDAVFCPHCGTEVLCPADKSDNVTKGKVTKALLSLSSAAFGFLALLFALHSCDSFTDGNRNTTDRLFSFLCMGLSAALEKEASSKSGKPDQTTSGDEKPRHGIDPHWGAALWGAVIALIVLLVLVLRRCES